MKNKTTAPYPLAALLHDFASFSDYHDHNQPPQQQISPNSSTHQSANRSCHGFRLIDTLALTNSNSNPNPNPSHPTHPPTHPEQELQPVPPGVGVRDPRRSGRRHPPHQPQAGPLAGGGHAVRRVGEDGDTHLGGLDHGGQEAQPWGEGAGRGELTGSPPFFPGNPKNEEK